MCLREVESGLYSSSFPVTPAFLSDLRRELDQNGVDGEGGSVNDGFLSLSFGGKGGFTPMGGNSSSALIKGKDSSDSSSSSGGGMAGEVCSLHVCSCLLLDCTTKAQIISLFPFMSGVKFFLGYSNLYTTSICVPPVITQQVSGTELAAFLTSRGLTFPIPKDREAFVSLLVDVHLYAHHRTEPPPSTAATTATATTAAEGDSKTAVSPTNDDITSSQSASSPSFPPTAASTVSPSEPISDAEWARVEALIKNPDADAKAENESKPVLSPREEKKHASKSTDSSASGNQTMSITELFAYFNDGYEKSSRGSAAAFTTQKGPRSPASTAQEEEGGGAEQGGLWQSTWTLGMRVDPRPGRRWDYEWHVADLDGAPLGLATRSIGASQTSEAVLEAESASMPDDQSTSIATQDGEEAAKMAAAEAAAVAAAKEAERAWAALSAAPYLMDDEEEKPGAFFPRAIKKKDEAQQPPSSTDATMDAASAVAGEGVEAKGEVKESEAKSKGDEIAIEPKDLPLGKTGRSKEI